MNFLGQEAISKATQTTGRTLLVLSFTLIVYRLGWIETADASIIGLKFRENSFALCLSVLICLVAVGHIIHWNGDRVSLAGWNIEGRHLARHIAGLGGSEIEGLISSFARSLDRETEGSKISEDGIANLRERLDTFNARLSDFRAYAIFYIWIWSLFVPIAIATVAILLPELA